MTVQSPALGYNTNVRHGGKLFHIQTEDSGVRHPHVITHLFADGGRIVATRKSSYAEHLGAPKLADIVKERMREQHKAMFIALRDGEFDEATDASIPAHLPRTSASIPPGADTIPPPAGAGNPGASSTDVRAQAFSREPTGSHAYQSARPAAILSTTEAPSGATFSPPTGTSMTLDEVILSYLAEDLEAQEQA